MEIIDSEKQNNAVAMTFTPEQPEFAEGAREYEQFWEQEGQRITEAWQQHTGLPFEDSEIKVIVFNKPSYAGNAGEPMHLRYSYPPDIKKGTLIHELGHRILSRLVHTQTEYDPHQFLDLVLFDLWVDLYGQEFAQANIDWEKKLKGIYDYEGTWDWALAMSSEERQKIFTELKSKTQEVKDVELETSQNVYSLPFPKDTKINHVTRDNEAHKGPFKGAQDFGVELGTQVLAPSEGIVVRVVDEHDKHGQTREFVQYSNVINIEHPNGEFSELVHLAKGSAKVNVGDSVTEGQELAETGLSGWMTAPHLHWLVFRKDQSLPRGFKGLEIRLKEKNKPLGEIAEELNDPNLETLIQNIAKNIRRNEVKVGGAKRATDILSSRFMPAQEAYDQGISSCGTITNISAEMLRHLGYKVKLVHGRIPQTPTHAWISVQDKEKEDEWHQYDLTHKDSQITPEHKPEYFVDSWEEIRPFLENWYKDHHSSE